MYDFQKLAPFITKCSGANHPLLKQAALSMQDAMKQIPTGNTQDMLLEANQDDAVIDGDLQQSEQFDRSQGIDNNQQNSVEEALMEQAMPFLAENEPGAPPDMFGKSDQEIRLSQNKQDQQGNPAANCPQLMTLHKAGTLLDALRKKASAYVGDVRVKDLPADVQKDVSRFIDVTGNPYVVRYGMVASELEHKADPHNLSEAQDHVRKSFASQSKDTLVRKVKDKLPNKFVLVMNDRMIDGHHFLAQALQSGVTNSLNVLDLTPARLTKKASLLDLLRDKYGQSHYSRKGAVKAASAGRFSRVRNY